ncbi:MerR family transcriptional regulator [Thalassospira marina]|uniref:MerR family transcriptional regulator n=1 Tax=Thalassospira marina TaxID=2048283 RepID=UPI001C2CC222|nr:MerR family transcriptional regulator [Thalassospira marina]
MKIGDLAKRSGLSAHTLRYYERIGLLPYADRDASGQRDYDETILIWIEFLRRLKETGMPIRDMLAYASLRNGGPATEQARHDILLAHRRQVQATITSLQANLLVLDQKIAGYAATMPRTHDDDTTQNTPATNTKHIPQPGQQRNACSNSGASATDFSGTNSNGRGSADHRNPIPARPARTRGN